VRGLVAARLGREYVGIDLRKDQIAANAEQAKSVLRKGDPIPHWIEGDAKQAGKLIGGAYDFLFTCPPYYDLEKYSKDPKDLSNFPTYDSFLNALEVILRASLSKLRNHRFAAIVVGEIRDKKGMQRGFPSAVIARFEKAGMELYNSAVLVTAVGSLAMRVGKMFEGARKLGPSHQYLFVFCKGDPKKACAALSSPEYGKAEDEGVEQAFGELL
jgi:hypothetical protein